MDLFRLNTSASNVNIGIQPVYPQISVAPVPTYTGITASPAQQPHVPIVATITPTFIPVTTVIPTTTLPTPSTIQPIIRNVYGYGGILPHEVWRTNDKSFFKLADEPGGGSVFPISSYNMLFANNISTGNILAGGSESDTLSTILFYADIVNIDEATISSISTNAIELDGAYLNTVGGTEVLLNGIPIATTANLSSIMDWAIFPAISTITPINNNIDIGAINNRFQTGYFSTIFAQTAILESTTLTLSETLSSQFVNVVFASTINVGTVNGNIGNFSTLNVSTLNSINAPTINISTVNGGNANFSTINAENAFISSISTNWLRVVPFDEGNENGGIFAGRAIINNLSTSFLRNAFEIQTNTLRTGSVLTNNITASNSILASTLNVRAIETVSTLRANRGEFSTLTVRRVEDVQTLTVNNGTFSTIFANTYFNIPSTISGSNWSQYQAISDVDFDTYDLNNCGDINCGDITSADIDCQDVDAGDIVCDNLQVGSSVTGLADVEIYGANAIPGDSALFVEGGVEFNGGLIHGFSAGALPLGPVNTQRFSLTPLGIAMISPTFISLNSGATMNQAVGGAYSLAVGGVGSLAFGTYCELNAGSLKLLNNTPIIFSALGGTGNPGGLNINTYKDSNSLQMDGLSFGCQEKISGQNSLRYVSSGSANQFLETISLPAIGQWYVKASYQINKLSGGGNQTDAYVYMAPTANPPISAFNQCIFGAPIYSMPSSQTLTINAPVVVSTITGYVTQIGSTITENFSTFLSTGQTFSTFTSTFYSTLVADGGLNIYFDGIQSQNAFTASIQRGTFLASYLGGYIPPV